MHTRHRRQGTVQAPAVLLAAVGALLLLGTSARAVDQGEIDRAVDKGVAYVKKRLTPREGIVGFFGRNGAPNAEVGAVALGALALLECGVPADDPVLRSAIDRVRAGAVPLTGTYAISLAILA